MFYSNSVGGKDIKYTTKNYSMFKGINADVDENVLPLNFSPMSYNFDYSDGSLRDGMGVGELKFRYLSYDFDAYKLIQDPPDDSFILACWYFTAWSTEFNIHRPFFMVYTSRGDFYYNRLHGVSTELVKMEGLNFTEKPIVASYNIEGRDSLILVSKADGMYVWQYPSIVKKIENAPLISSLCVHENKLFITTHGEKREVLFSDNLDPTSFSVNDVNGGSFKIIDEFGTCNKVISFDGYLYIIRDFNIAKLVSYENSVYNINQLYVSNGRIYEDTVCICGDKIFYLASDGVYSFDGSKAKKIGLNINRFLNGVDNSNAVAGYSSGYYYLACRLNYNDGLLVDDQLDTNFTNNALLRIDVASGEMIMMRGHDVVGIYVINDLYKNEVCVQVKEYGGQSSVGKLDMSGKYFNKKITKVWNSPMSDFGAPDKIKLLKEVTFETKQDITIEVETENGVKEFSVKGKVGYQTIKPLVKGKKIAINFISKAEDNMISNPCVKVGYL